MGKRGPKGSSPEQIVNTLRQVEALVAQGQTVAQAVVSQQISEQTYYRWKKQYGSMERDEVKRLKALEQENARLKKLVAELSLDKDLLQEALKGNY